MVFVMGLISLLVTAGLMAAYGRRARTVVVRDPLADAMAEYERRLADTDKDVARGTLTAAEADVAKAEIGRQLLSQKKVLEKTDGEAVPSGQTLAQNRGVIDAIVLLTIAVLPAVAGVLYWQLGSPGFADQPLAQRVTPANPQTQAAASGSNADLAPLTPTQSSSDRDEQLRVFVTELEAQLRVTPGDLDALALLARSQEALGNPEKAAQAWRALLAREADNRDGLWFLGLNALARGDVAEARASWTTLRTQYDPGTQDYDLLTQALATLDAPADAPLDSKDDG